MGGYHIDKTGMVTGEDNLDLEDALRRLGFDTEEREYDEPDTYESGLGELSAWEYPEGPGMVPAQEDRTPVELAIDVPLDGFTPESLSNLTKMVAAKEALLKAALGAEDLPIQVTEDTIRFPWFTLDDPSDAACCTQFVEALCRTAKQKKRVTARDRGLTDNPRYAMRYWLLSLGLTCGEYAGVRKLLLSKLPGNSAFKSGSRPIYTAHCYTRSEKDEMDSVTEFTSFTKAKAHCDMFAAECDGALIAGAHVEDENGKCLYELLCD